MMQNGELQLLDDDAVRKSLRSIRWEISDDQDPLSKFKIVGNDSHIVEGLMRAAELAKKDKSLKAWIGYI